MEIQTIEPVYTREVNERMVKCIESTYSKTDIEHVAADATHLNAEQITQLLGILTDFEGLFDGNLGDWDKYTTDLELNTNSKPFNCKY